jgi:hypothetical protein
MFPVKTLQVKLVNSDQLHVVVHPLHHSCLQSSLHYNILKISLHLQFCAAIFAAMSYQCSDEGIHS